MLKIKFVSIGSWGDREPYYWTTYHVHWRELKYSSYYKQDMWNSRGWNFRIPKPINLTLRLLLGHREFQYSYKVRYDDGSTQGYGTDWLLESQRDGYIYTGEDIIDVKIACTRWVYDGWKFKGWSYLWYRTKKLLGSDICVCKKRK